MKTKRNLALQLLLLGGFCAAAQNSNIFQDDMNTVFQVDRSFGTTGLLFFRNVNKAISSIQVDFGNGAGFRSVTMGSPISITYNSDGEKVLVLKITYTDGQVLQSRSKINVSGILATCLT